MYLENYNEEKFINYLNITNNFEGQHSLNTKEWHYIMSNLDNNKFLLKKLNEKKLLPQEVNICDAGIGLGTALFDLFLQSKSLPDINFNFYGIEKNKQYINFLNEKLIFFWENKLKIINSDLTIQNYSNYNIVYSFLPFKDQKNLFNFYIRVSNQLSKGSLIIENSIYEKFDDAEKILQKVPNIELVDLDGYLIFRKTK